MNIARQLDYATLIPEPYAGFRPLLREALARFIDRLPAKRRRALETAIRALPQDATDARRLVAVLRHSPTLHKLGQVLARHPALNVELRRNLQTLESLAPSTPIRALQSRIEQATSARPDLRITVGDRPLAEGSVAVVVPFTWQHDDGPTERGVFKILRPGIEEALEAELVAWHEVTSAVQTHAGAMGALDLSDTLERVGMLLRSEVCLHGEQRHLREAAGQFADLPDVRIPALLPMSTERVTAMQWIEGGSVTDPDVDRESPSIRRRLAAALCAAALTGPFLSPKDERLFHGDPHAGNLLATGDGRLGMLDWSLAGRLTKATRERLAQMLLGALALDGPRICRALEALCVDAALPGGLPEAVRRALGPVSAGRLPGLRWLKELLDTAARRHGVRFDTDLLLLRKSLVSVEGVLREIDRGFDVDAALFRAATGAMGWEWPWRMLAPPTSRAFATHVSTLDLLWAGYNRPFNLLHTWAT